MKSKIIKILKWTISTILALGLLVFALGYWFLTLIPEPSADKEQTSPEDLVYLEAKNLNERGKILIVLTSADQMGASGKSTGYELTELSRPYYVFRAHGYEVDIASPKGGEPPVIIDNEDMGVYDYAFLNDEEAQERVKNSIPTELVRSMDYKAIFIAGGKGAMYDFPTDSALHNIIASQYESGNVIGAVCHGPAALLNVKLKDGSYLVTDRSVSAFTNEEELFLIPEAKDLFPFLLEDALRQRGANFTEGLTYLRHTVRDGNLVTGQNPWSTWKVAEQMIEAMGMNVKSRITSPQENAVDILNTYHLQGFQQAKKALSDRIESQKMEVDRTLIAMHAIVSVMKWNIIDAIKLVRLVALAKSMDEKD